MDRNGTRLRTGRPRPAGAGADLVAVSYGLGGFRGLVPPAHVPCPACPGDPWVWGFWTMLSIGPCAGFMSLSPLKAQTELAWAGAPVLTPEPENGTPGVPGRPVTSPAEATPALAHASAAPHAAATKNDFVRMFLHPF
jgi:hypothetical protein